MQRRAQTAKGASPDAPEAAAPCKEFERLETAWYTKRLPNLAANMRLVIAVFDRSGPGLARVDDDTDAMWNNKFSCVGQRIQSGSNAIEVMNRTRGCAARRVDATTEVKPAG